MHRSKNKFFVCYDLKACRENITHAQLKTGDQTRQFRNPNGIGMGKIMLLTTGFFLITYTELLLSYKFRLNSHIYLAFIQLTLFYQNARKIQLNVQKLS